MSDHTPSFALRLVGLVTMLGLLLLTASGVWLLFFYQPSAASAWDDIDALRRQIAFGLRVRQLHRLLVLPVTLSGLLWTVMFATARIGRNTVLAATAFGAALIGIVSGLFLPWDQLALWSVTVGTNVTGYSPIFGDEVKFVLLDGVVVSPAVIRSWLILHVLAGVVAVVAAGIALLLIRSGSGPGVTADRSAP